MTLHEPLTMDIFKPLNHMKFACSYEWLFLRRWHKLQTRPQRCHTQIGKRWVRRYLPMSLSSLTSSSCWSCCRMKALSTQHSVPKHSYTCISGLFSTVVHRLIAHWQSIIFPRWSDNTFSHNMAILNSSHLHSMLYRLIFRAHINSIHTTHASSVNRVFLLHTKLSWRYIEKALQILCNLDIKQETSGAKILTSYSKVTKKDCHFLCKYYTFVWFMSLITIIWLARYCM